jgi:hypothetical protein
MFEPEPEAMAQQFLQEVREQFGLTSDASSEEIHAAISKAWRTAVGGIRRTQSPQDRAHALERVGALATLDRKVARSFATMHLVHAS